MSAVRETLKLGAPMTTRPNVEECSPAAPF